MEKVDIGKLIDEETTRRLEIMSSPDYEWPERADKRDAIAIVVIIAICIFFVILAMTGVIV